MPYDNQQIQSLQMSADLTRMSNSLASQSLRVLVQSARQVHVVSPNIVPENMPGIPSFAESLGGRIVNQNT